MLSQPALNKSAAYRWGATTMFTALAVILAALAFEHLGGYAACPLCLQQRYAYYLGIPALFIGLVLLTADERRIAAIVMLGAALLFLANAGLGVYQAGAEWGYWPGPSSCAAAGPLTTNAGNLLAEIAKTPVVNCVEPAFRFLGLSFAGWNAVISFCLFVGALKAAFSVRDDEVWHRG